MRELIYTYLLYLQKNQRKKNSEISDHKNWVKEQKKINGKCQ